MVVFFGGAGGDVARTTASIFSGINVLVSGDLPQIASMSRVVYPAAL
jgi:hypothetical protein